MSWVAVLVVSYVWLGLRQRKAGGSTTLTLFMTTSLVLGVVYLFVLK